MVQKLGLEVSDHPEPYHICRLNEHQVIRIDKQVKVSFCIGQYKDEVLCDVLPMESSHLLLGRPWQFDKKVQHEGFTNRYIFDHHGKNPQSNDSPRSISGPATDIH